MKKLLLVVIITLVPVCMLMAQPLNQPNFSTKFYASYLQCVGCHQSQPEDDLNKQVGAPSAWLPSMMSNAFRDPLWQAKVETEMNRNSQLRDVLDAKCSHCHGPVAVSEAKMVDEQLRIFDYKGAPGLNNPENPRYFQAMEGITCTVCHQMQLDGELEKSEYSGRWKTEFDTVRGGTDRKLFGNFSEPKHGVDYNMAGYGVVYSPAISTSEACGVCHEIRTPVVDVNTKQIIDGAEFVEQSTYNEWQNSEFGDDNITCQECHMPPMDGVTIAGNPARNNFHVHTFQGSNTAMLDLFKRNSAELGVSDTYLDVDFDHAIEITRRFLRESTANLSVKSQVFSGDNLEVVLNVENKSGHKLPTGIQARRMWIYLSVVDEKGDVIFESGKMNEDGTIVGSVADSSAGKQYEPHYDVITSGKEVQIYEAVMKDVNNDPTFTILFANGYIKDNRILPRGYIEHPDTHAYGKAATDGNFIGGSDQVTYRIPGLKPGKYKVNARLMFQALGKPFMEDIFRDKTPAVERMKLFYDQPGLIQAEELQSTTITVTKLD